MAVEEERVSIVAWPEGPALLRHGFDADQPCPVTVAFAPTPANVVVSSRAEQPVHVQMNMQVAAGQSLPVCISVCEPICARSDYRIGIQVFNNPFATIDVRGTTRLFQCRDAASTQEVCVDFQALKIGQPIAQPIVIEGVTFAAISDPLHTATFGEPAGTTKLGFPASGVRITFDAPVRDARLTINNYGSQTIDVTAFAGTTVLSRTSEQIHNTARSVTIARTGITSIELRGGNNEAGLVAACYTPEDPKRTVAR